MSASSGTYLWRNSATTALSSTKEDPVEMPSPYYQSANADLHLAIGQTPQEANANLIRCMSQNRLVDLAGIGVQFGLPMLGEKMAAKLMVAVKVDENLITNMVKNDILQSCGAPAQPSQWQDTVPLVSALELSQSSVENDNVMARKWVRHLSRTLLEKPIERFNEIESQLVSEGEVPSPLDVAILVNPMIQVIAYLERRGVERYLAVYYVAVNMQVMQRRIGVWGDVMVGRLSGKR